MKLKSELNYKLNKSKLILPHLPHSDNFLRTLSSILYGARWFGVIDKSTSPAVIWTVCILISLVVIEVVAIWRVIRALSGIAVDTVGHRSVTGRVSGAIFYLNAICSLILTCKLTSSWPKLAAHWSLAERTPQQFIANDKSIRDRIIWVSIFVCIGATVEHLLSMVTAVGIGCPSNEILERYIVSSHGFLITKSQYTICVGLFLFVMSKIATILWNFQDLFITLICMGLVSRYQKLNGQVLSFYKLQENPLKRSNTALSWRRVRENFVKQATIVRQVNNKVGSLMFLSNFNNMYFICLQLFLGITGGIGHSINRVYYLLSLLWLCARASTVVLVAAEVHLQSRKSLPLLYSCSEFSYSIEVKRLIKQLSTDHVALSGKDFYYLDRTILLKAATTLITYELVLIQFDAH